MKGGESEAAKLFKEFSKKIKNYKNDRDYPIIEGTSNLSPYIRFGNISIRKLVKASYISKGEGAETWLSELIWREFYKMILYKFPHVETEAFRKEYSNIKWPGKKAHFEKWKEGMTGYPIIDAAMRDFKKRDLCITDLEWSYQVSLLKTSISIGSSVNSICE